MQLSQSEHRESSLAELGVQLTVEGREIPLDAVPDSGRPAPLTDRQRAILGVIAREGSITPSEAGTIMHAGRPLGLRPTGARCSSGGRPLVLGSAGCCEYAAADGSRALRRLARRGYVFRSMVGIWEATR